MNERKAAKTESNESVVQCLCIYLALVLSLSHLYLLVSMLRSRGVHLVFIIFHFRVNPSLPHIAAHNHVYFR